MSAWSSAAMSLVVHDAPPRGSDGWFSKAKNATLKRVNDVNGKKLALASGVGAVVPGGTLLMAGGLAAGGVKTALRKNGEQFVKRDCLGAIGSHKTRNGWSPEQKKQCDTLYEQGAYKQAYNEHKKSNPEFVDAYTSVWGKRCGSGREEGSKYKGFCGFTPSSATP